MRITSWNFLHGQTLGPAGESAAALHSLQSDLLALQEVDYHQERSGSGIQPEEVASTLGAQWWGFAPTLHGTPGVSWKKLPQQDQKVLTDNSESAEMYGIAIVSKVPVRSWLRLELGKSLIGMPLAIANESGKLRLLYVKDEPRVALAAILENGYAVINTHLSFIPFVNLFQLMKVSRWARTLEKLYGVKVILVGDFNLPWGIPNKLTQWKRATQALTYPSWAPKISFDYIFMKNLSGVREFGHEPLQVSDHRPISIDLEMH